MDRSLRPAFTLLGSTDDVTTCEQCGRPELRGTVCLAVLDVDGNQDGVVHYGSVCAARALGTRGGGRAVRQSARWAHEHTIAEARNARAILARYGADDLGNFPRRGVFERAVTADYQRYWDAPFAHRLTERADWAALLAGHVAGWAAQIAAAKLLDPAF